MSRIPNPEHMKPQHPESFPTGVKEPLAKKIRGKTKDVFPNDSGDIPNSSLHLKQILDSMPHLRHPMTSYEKKLIAEGFHVEATIIESQADVKRFYEAMKQAKQKGKEFRTIQHGTDKALWVK
jgi:hypothetical protein